MLGKFSPQTNSFGLDRLKQYCQVLTPIYNLADPPIIPFTNPENCFKIDSSKYNASRPAFNDFSFCELSKVSSSLNVKTLENNASIWETILLYGLFIF